MHNYLLLDTICYEDQPNDLVAYVLTVACSVNVIAMCWNLPSKNASLRCKLVFHIKE